jgi:three-Cys-motif partner protein
MIAIEVLKGAQKRILADTGRLRRIRCFFSESDQQTYHQLEKAVAPHHDPSQAFEIQTHFGRFEDAVPKIKSAIGAAFPLIFIDPTGWTGYPFEKIRTIFDPPKCEVLINFMYDFVNRFVASQDETIIATLNPILGGPGWRSRLDPSLPLGPAVEQLFRETLKKEGRFDYVISTKIDKSTSDRPHFFLAYGTKSSEGLKAFRETEYSALRAYAKTRANAKEKKLESRSNITDMFAGHEGEVQESTTDDLVDEQKSLATAELLRLLSKSSALKFSDVVIGLLQPFMLRETNVKDICVELAKVGTIEKTWGGGNRKPQDSDVIRL